MTYSRVHQRLPTPYKKSDQSTILKEKKVERFQIIEQYLIRKSLKVIVRQVCVWIHVYFEHLSSISS